MKSTTTTTPIPPPSLLITLLNSITTTKLFFFFSHRTHPLQKSSHCGVFFFEKNPVFISHTLHTHSIMHVHSMFCAYMLYTLACRLTLSVSFTHTNTLREGDEVKITLPSRMQKKFMLPLERERERGILCELRWAIILFSTQTRKGPFSGNVPPTDISPRSRGSPATFGLNGQMSICHSAGMCYFYRDYFYLHLFPWRQVITFCLET